jgi:hypothetical protein
MRYYGSPTMTRAAPAALLLALACLLTACHLSRSQEEGGDCHPRDPSTTCRLVKVSEERRDGSPDAVLVTADYRADYENEPVARWKTTVHPAQLPALRLHIERQPVVPCTLHFAESYCARPDPEVHLSPFDGGTVP